MLPLCLVYCLFMQTSAWGQCSSTAGPNAGTSPGTAGGGLAWANIARIQAPDLSYSTSTAIFSLLGGTSTSKYITLKDFSFAIPPLATICGIQVDITRYGSGLISLFGTVSDQSVKIIQGGVIGGTEMSTGANWGGAPANTSFGGNGSLWGLTWTAADINSANFGVAMSVSFQAALIAVTLTANIDYVQIKIYYDNSLLSIPLQHFSASRDEATDLLSWTVPSSNDLAKFGIQRSDGSGKWSDLASVDAVAPLMQYTYRDIAPLPGVNDYRLHLESLDGRDSYSSIQEISRSDYGLSVYPNPVASLINISGKVAFRRVVVADLTGRTITVINTDGPVHDLQVPVAGLRPGIYLLQIDRTVMKWIKN